VSNIHRGAQPDQGRAGMVLIGMPGIEKRIAGFPQFYSRIGFVHEFRALDANQVQELLAQRWTPAGIKLPDGPLSPEVVGSLIRMTGGNFRLLARLVTQIERVRPAVRDGFFLLRLIGNLAVSYSRAFSTSRAQTCKLTLRSSTISGGRGTTDNPSSLPCQNHLLPISVIGSKVAAG
jgi:hypothetical protein